MRFRTIFPLLVLLVVCAQARAQNSTAPGVATRRVVLNMKNRGPITGNFIRADADSIEVEDQGNVVTVPLEQVSSIVFDFVDVSSSSASAATTYSNTTAMNGAPATINGPTTAAPVMSTSTRRSRRDARPAPSSNTLSSSSLYTRTRSHSRARRSPGVESMTFSSKREAERALARLNGTASRSKKDSRAKKESSRSSKNNQSSRGRRRR